jgi:nicotinamide mononucleotide (NMN) deamidase PncC
LKQKILEQLADSVYADDGSTLEECVAKLLADRGEKLVLVESASGGSLAAALEADNGSRDVLAGAFAAPGENRLRQLLQVSDDVWAGRATDSERIGILAARAAEVTQSQWAVAVGDVRTGEDGNEYVEIVLKQPGRELEIRSVRLSGKGESAHFRLSTEVFDHLRRKLLPRE